eukprot:TRINITY_DN6106_c0_g1_i3.p1 TRINITY_DN6106_c0_g1~~TRINITY_DN6106_c0_g1_i3.p1  ORF type:complete len:174 (+),score=3.62 TRINITY_DN6106_c0_g1_i3:24-545(+)
MEKEVNQNNNNLPYDRITSDLFDPPLDSDYVCTICINVLNRPVQTICGHSFCNDCISTYRKLSESCPICRENLGNGSVFPDKKTERQISSKIVNCPNRECKEKTDYGNIFKHLDTCMYEIVECTQNCKMKIERGILEEHITHTCPKTKVKCEFDKCNVCLNLCFLISTIYFID